MAIDEERYLQALAAIEAVAYPERGPEAFDLPRQAPPRLMRPTLTPPYTSGMGGGRMPGAPTYPQTRTPDMTVGQWPGLRAGLEGRSLRSKVAEDFANLQTRIVEGTAAAQQQKQDTRTTETTGVLRAKTEQNLRDMATAAGASQRGVFVDGKRWQRRQTPPGEHGPYQPEAAFATRSEGLFPWEKRARAAAARDAERQPPAYEIYKRTLETLRSQHLTPETKMDRLLRQQRLGGWGTPKARREAVAENKRRTAQEKKLQQTAAALTAAEIESHRATGAQTEMAKAVLEGETQKEVARIQAGGKLNREEQKMAKKMNGILRSLALMESLQAMDPADRNKAIAGFQEALPGLEATSTKTDFGDAVLAWWEREHGIEPVKRG